MALRHLSAIRIALSTEKRRLLCAWMVAACLVCALLQAPQLVAQPPQTGAAHTPSFEVASVKPNRSADGRVRLMFGPDGFTAEGISTKALISFAYNMKEFQISGGPGWLDSETFNINAKVDESTMEALKKLPPEQATEQRRLMMQSLLAERFKLKISQSSKDLPIYALVVAKNGPKVTKSAEQPPGSSPGGPRSTMRLSPGELTGKGIPISTLADRLSREVGRKVVDKTGLQGQYDFMLHWTPERQGSQPGGAADSGQGPAASPDSSGPSIFTAIQEQLGLKLESQKGPVETLIIDSVEKPSED